MRIENRMQLQLWREECKEKRQKENCCILVCGGTGCLAGGSDKIYTRLKELTSNMDHVTVKIGEEIAHVGLKMSGCHGFCEMGPLVRIEPYNYLYLKVKLWDNLRTFGARVCYRSEHAQETSESRRRRGADSFSVVHTSTQRVPETDGHRARPLA